MGVSLDHNIPDVASDVEDVKDDLHQELRRRVAAAMRTVWADAKQYVLDDSHTTGQLFSSIENESDIGDTEMQFTVSAGSNNTDYAAIVEYGSGRRRGETGEMSKQFIPFQDGEQKPPDWPYSSPDNINRFELAPIIEEWMYEKDIWPESGSMWVSALGIATKIIQRGTYAHPYLRPAWFENELKVKRAARNAVRNATR